MDNRLIVPVRKRKFANNSLKKVNTKLEHTIGSPSRLLNEEESTQTKRVRSHTVMNKPWNPSKGIGPTFVGNTTLPDNVISLIIRYVFRQQPRKAQRDLYQTCLTSRQFYRKGNRFLWYSPCIPSTDILRRFISCTANTQLKQDISNPPPRQCQPLLLSVSPFVNVPTGSRYRAMHHVRILNVQESLWSDHEYLVLMPFLTLLEKLVLIGRINLSADVLRQIRNNCKGCRIVKHPFANFFSK